MIAVRDIVDQQARVFAGRRIVAADAWRVALCRDRDQKSAVMCVSAQTFETLVILPPWLCGLGGTNLRFARSRIVGRKAVLAVSHRNEGVLAARWIADSIRPSAEESGRCRARTRR